MSFAKVEERVRTGAAVILPDPRECPNRRVRRVAFQSAVRVAELSLTASLVSPAIGTLTLLRPAATGGNPVGKRSLSLSAQRIAPRRLAARF